MDVKIISILFYVLLAAIPIEITVSSAIVSKQLSSTAKLKQPQVRLTKPSSIKNTSHNEPTGEAPEEDIELALWDNGGDEESGMYSDSEVLGAIMQQARRSWKQEFDDSKNDKSTRPSASEDSEPIIEKSFNERAIPMIDDLDDEEFDSNAYPDIDQLADQHKYKDTMRQRDQLIVKRDDPIGELEVWWRRGKGSFTKYSYPYKSYSGGAKGPARVASLARPSTGRAASSGVASTSSPTDISRRNGAVAHVRSGDGLHSAGVAWSRADTKSSRKI